MQNLIKGLGILFLSATLGTAASNRTIASTVPANGDVNPYGVAMVPRTVGALVEHSVLVSNFNNVNNLQGTGTTIVQISPSGKMSQFAQISGPLPGACPGGVGLTTALAVLSSGWVIVGSLPTTDGTSATARAGCLIVLNSQGQPVETFSDSNINGPWDMTALDLGSAAVLFVSNVLNGTVAGNGQPVSQGTVLRILLSIPQGGMPQIVNETIIGSGLGERTDPAALVIGPTGLGLALNGTLYVADTLANRIAAIPNAVNRTTSDGTGTTIAQGNALNGPLGLAVEANGGILTVNGNDGNLVETSPQGQQLSVLNIDTTGTGGGTLFGVAAVPGGLYFVNDGNNTLNLLRGNSAI